MGLKASAASCVILKSASGGIGDHLPAISKIVQGTDKQISLDTSNPDGACRIVLPAHYCAVRTQALVNRLRALTDGQGRPLLEAKISAPQAPTPRPGQ